MRMQSIIRAIYPAQCVACDTLTEVDNGLCGPCWRETQFIDGTICDTCGAPLPGEGDGQRLTCDDCMVVARPWGRGRAVLVYAGIGRKLVLGLKHGDRTDLAQPAGIWMARLAQALIRPDTVIVPVPLHWARLLRRRYNQSALLAQSLARQIERPVCVDALLRPRKTASLEGHSRDARFAVLSGSISINPRQQAQIAGKPVLLVDDVMTSGATLAACAEVLLQAGATDVSMITLARVVKDA
ncbi:MULTISPECIES: ComF family protein [unclassified Yoonia]|uniref:ComF family protein n=1 Tax=unclassified Yoonia TaxID=2629118 RepID=UPI002B000C86|nr:MULTISPECIES: ComF family protein [unclassified Yoonia]